MIAFIFENDIVDLDENELKTALENLPCCTTNKGGTNLGDPINLVIIGDFNDVAAAFVRQGWLPAEETYSTAVWKTIKSYFFGSRYRYSPISSLYFDIATRILRARNPVTTSTNGTTCACGTAAFALKANRCLSDRSVAISASAFAEKLATRDPQDRPGYRRGAPCVLEDLLFSQMVAKVGYVKGVGRATPSRPRTNLTGDPYFTDGLRAVLILEPGPISLDQLQSLDWEHPKTFQDRTRFD